jgi:hypothetical protein
VSPQRLATSILAASLCLIASVSCGSPPGGAPSAAEPPPAASNVPAANEAQQAAPAVPAVDAEFPAAIVGTWSGGDGKKLTFGADGRYQSNSQLGEGQAVVSGDRITLTPDGQQGIVTTWSVSGGKLYLGTSVYLRDDSGSGSLSLVGTWIEANGYATFRFAADGTYDFSDPARGHRSQGTYAVEGRTLTISPSGVAPASFGLDYDGTYLRFTNPDGTNAGEYIRAG